MRTQFDIQLEALKTEMTTIGMLCENAIAKTSHALLTGDTALAGEMTELLNQVVQKERDIETICLKLLLHQQPVARDLRTVSSALKMVTDAQRIGTQGVQLQGHAKHRAHGLGQQHQRRDDGQPEIPVLDSYPPVDHAFPPPCSKLDNL